MSTALRLLASAVSLALAAEPGQPDVLHHHQGTRVSMACTYAIDAYGPDPAALQRIVEDAFDEVDRIDRLMSHYRPGSALSRLNREAARQAVPVDPELFELIAESIRYARMSDGAFDITVGPLMKAWGFFRGEGRVPADEELAAARSRVGSRHLLLDDAGKTVRFAREGVELDLGGIAKGYAVDRVARLLRDGRIPAALISAGGSTIYGLGSPPGGDGWEVAVEDPLVAGQAALRVRLTDRALSVAGRAEKSFEWRGETYSHIMDPRTGRPARGVLSVAVLAGTGTAGDALDDAFFVLGPDESRRYANRFAGAEAFLFLPKEHDGWTLVAAHGRQ